MITIGDKIGKLIVLQKDLMTQTGQKWLCQCECGNTTSVREDNLEIGRMNAKGGTRSCGCLNPVQNHCRGIKRPDRIGTVINDYQYILRLMPDSNRSYNFLFYDLTNGMWRVSDPRHVKDLSHSKRYECISADISLQKYYKKISTNKFSQYENENNIMTMLFNNNFIWSKQYAFADCCDKVPLPFDIAIFNEDFDLDYIIEYDGEQHFFVTNNVFNYEKCRQHDLIKNKYCFDHNIPLIRIPYDADYTLDDLKLATTRFLFTPENEKEYYESKQK